MHLSLASQPRERSQPLLPGFGLRYFTLTILPSFTCTLAYQRCGSG